jgi:hypothetical protein
VSRKLRILSKLQQWHSTELAQHEGAPDTPYSPSQRRKILEVLGQVEQHLRTRVSPGRRRLRHLVARLEVCFPTRTKSRSRTTDKPAPAAAAPPREVLQQNPRPFSPYRKKKAESYSTMTLPGARIEELDVCSKPSSHLAAECQARPLCIELTVRDEQALDLTVTYPAILANISRLRVLLCSTGIVLPSVTLSVNSSRLGESAGVLRREVEVSTFQLTRLTCYPLPNWIETSNRIRVEGISCEFRERPLLWPVHRIDQRSQLLIQLCRVAGTDLEQLLSRQAVLNDLERPAYSSHRYASLAAALIRKGLPVPRGRFLELSLHLSKKGEWDGLSLHPETRDLPCQVAVGEVPLPFFTRTDCVFLTLAQLGSPRIKLWKRVETKLSKELQRAVHICLEQVSEASLSGMRPEGEFERFSPFLNIQLYEKYLEALSHTERWQEFFGPPQFVLTTGYALVERILASEARDTAAELTHYQSQAWSEKLSSKDPDWLAAAILLSHLSENSTTYKVRNLARRSPGRLARILEKFDPQSAGRYRTPLEKISIFCSSLGGSGLALKEKLTHYLPPLPQVHFNPQEAHQVQLEMLRRSRVWTIHGQGSSLPLN